MRVRNFAIAIMATVLAGPAVAQWAPTKPLEFVVGAGPGGGTDQFARTVQTAIQKHHLLDVDVIVTNKPGGAGAETFMYGITSGNDPHKLLYGNNNAWLLPMKAKVGYKMSDLTPIASMAADEFILWVKADAPYKNVHDLIEAAKTASPKLKLGGTQSKDGDEILTRLIAERSGADFTYIPFKSGSEAAVQLAGGHIDANTNNPSENVGQWKGGTVRPLCVFSSKRMSTTEKVTETQGFSDIPTCTEEGLAIADYQLPRTIFAAGKLTDDQLAFYVDLLREVGETPEWKDYVAKTGQTDGFLAGSDFQKLIERNEGDSRQIFEKEGWMVN